MNTKDETPHWIGGKATPGTGERLQSRDPSTGEVIYEWSAATETEVEAAVSTARAAQEEWANRSRESRQAILEKYGELVQARAGELSRLIEREVGKPPWEAATEVAAIAGKVGLSIQAYAERCGDFQKGPAWTRFKPHGVVGVFGPFNFPGHLPNGHIVPALLAGNAVVFKPSEQAPTVGRRLVELLVEAGLPASVINLVQGARETGAALADHAGLDGVFFTGSVGTGIALSRLFAESPGKILALELGGNNPLLLDKVADPRAALAAILPSAFITAGQRCTCARRLVIVESEANRAILAALVAATEKLVAGPPQAEPVPFLGPVISPAAAEKLLGTEQELQNLGGRVLVPLRRGNPDTGLISPGLIDMTEARERPDEEAFGPLLQVVRVESLEAAIEEANRTRFGLAAGILTDDREHYETFFRRSRTGIVNWNVQLTGASGAAPFGGIGLSGNHRPSGYFAADYCSYPVASMEREGLTLPEKLPPGLPL